MALPKGNDLKLGQIVGTNRELVLPKDGRDKHLYVCGATGTGKSKFLENLILQDIKNWHKSKSGLLLLDPHGSLYDAVMTRLAFARPKGIPIIPIDLRCDSWVVSYNALRRRSHAEPSVVVDGFVDAMAHVWGADGVDATPRLARWAPSILHTLYDNGLTLLEAEFLLDHLARGARLALREGVSDRWARKDWLMANKLSARDFEEQLGSTANRLVRFLRNPKMRSIFGQTDVSLDLGRALEEGHIVLVSLATAGAQVSEENADLFATLLLTDLWKAAQERGKRPGVKPFYVYLDEFQRFVTPSIAAGLDEARGFGLHLTMANQYPQQILDRGEGGKRLYHSVMENASSKAVFRLQSEENLRPLAQWLFMGVLNPDEIKLRIDATKVVGYYQDTEHTSTESRSRTRSRLKDASGELVSESETEGTAQSGGMHNSLIPILGTEVSSIQFRSLDEQLFRAMQSLYDQQQKHCCVRLVGMSGPVSLVTPHITPRLLNPERVKDYAIELLQRWDFARTAEDARDHVEKRLKDMETSFAGAIINDEPATAKRKLRTKVPRQSIS